MKKAELIKIVAEKTGSKSQKDAAVYVDAVFETIKEAMVQGEKVTLTGFGVFEVRDRAAKQCKNPRTHEMQDVPACKAPAFKAGKNLKEAVNK
ncbi:MAG: HU family DNA-binding protein [Oscillospiraceae bacterium]|jgi:nucleoid DNA-binding protein|nr:HU family DNA-binding protein [Oscillospiraceae bacterium]